MRKITSLVAASTALAITYHYSCKEKQTFIQKTIPSFKNRSQHLKEVQANPNYDVIVIGGGCNGAGVLLDASTRGLRTLMIEKDDFGSGASSKSTKLIHGGVRYLQQVFDFSTASLSSRKEKFDLVKQSIIQRGLMIDSASHLTSKVPFVIPCTNLFYGLYYYIGSMVYYLIYEWFAPKNGTIFNAPYFLNRQQLVEIFPHINKKYSMGVVYQDGSFNDSRLLLNAVLTATVGNGIKMPDSFVPANALNRAQLVDFIKNTEGKIQGVLFKDLLKNKTYKVYGKYVVNCTGVWADKVRLMADPNANKRICIVGGSHVVYDSKIASRTFGLAAPSADGRIVLVQPWLGRVLAGTTEKKFKEPTNNPKCSDQERNFINKAMMDFMSELDVQSFYAFQKTRWCGLRPLVVNDADHPETKSIARNHVIEEQPSGLLSLMGGKWTTYRKMGEDLVNLICQKEKEKGRELPQSQTAGLKLLGSSPQSYRNMLVKQKGDIGGQLYNEFGWLSDEVLKGDLSRLYGSTTTAELDWIVKNQLVTSIQDVLMRRTRLCFLISKKDVIPLANHVGRLLQKQNKWSETRTREEIDRSVENILSYEFE